MVETKLFAAWVATHYLSVSRRLGIQRVDSHGQERGDVPGWVMVTVMTAGLVVGIFAAFKAQIGTAVTNAINSVTDTTSSSSK